MNTEYKPTRMARLKSLRVRLQAAQEDAVAMDEDDLRHWIQRALEETDQLIESKNDGKN